MIKDLIHNIFLKERLEGIWRPGPIPGKKEMRVLYDKLAHCSVMKLTSNRSVYKGENKKIFSMNKLFDLMVMHCKYEFLMIDSPQQVEILNGFRFRRFSASNGYYQSSGWYQKSLPRSGRFFGNH